MAEGKALIRYFCVPCKPTKANGGRMRNLPEHDPVKWSTFIAYNKRDAETEMAIQQKLSKFPVPDFLWEEYHLDQEINDRGIQLDMVLVEQAIAIDNRSREELSAKMRQLTALENPNSVQQMKEWLTKHGLEVDSLDKKAVKELLKTAPPELAEVLELRRQLAKSSVKKYQAMQNAVCADGRARGMFQFYGANRSGRWAGRLIQLQNLPQNHMTHLEDARRLVRAGDYALLSALYDSVPEVLSELIRTAFVPRGRVQIHRFRLLCHRSPCAFVFGQRVLAAEGLCGERRHLLRQCLRHVPCASGKAWAELPSETERQNRRTGPGIRRIGRRPQVDGRFGDGSCRGGTPAPCGCVAHLQSEHRTALVGCGQCRKNHRPPAAGHGNARYPVPLPQWDAVHHSAFRPPALLCEAEDGDK